MQKRGLANSSFYIAVILVLGALVFASQLNNQRTASFTGNIIIPSTDPRSPPLEDTPQIIISELGFQTQPYALEGKVHVFSVGGNPLYVPGNLLFTFTGASSTPQATGDTLGYSVDSARDINGDGFLDFLAGSHRARGSQNARPLGITYVLSGKDGSVIRSLLGSCSSPQLDCGLGIATTGLGDINKDGYEDYALGAQQSDQSSLFIGYLYIMSGKDGKQLISLKGEGSYHNFGSSVARVGDINKDTYPDILVGAFGWRPVGQTTPVGKIYLYSGKDFTLLFSWNGDPIQGYSFGQSLAGLNDINNDGYSDIIVGDPNYASVGEVYVYSGKDQQLLSRLTPSVGGSGFGYAVSGINDVNNDRTPDFIVGAPGINTNAVYVYSGKDFTLIRTIQGCQNSYDQFGLSVSDVRDINSNGYPEILIGAPFAPCASSIFNPGPGEAYIYDGKTGNLIKTLRAAQPTNGAAFGYALSAS